ncbi:hypothetical protein, partial [Mycolicibacterium sp. 018/SC-01/001]|uniref:hypothetical protein n=1 Tax=Mycolicibacterium sp. 018/SC-01/001 TaxID=2592069 RepID=UPI001C8F57EC
ARIKLSKQKPRDTPGRIRIRKIRSQKPETSGKKQLRPQTGKCGHNKKQQTKTTKHTIEFSNNRRRFQATLPLYCM